MSGTKVTIRLFFILSALLTGSLAHAAANNVPFTANVDTENRCTVRVDRNGTLQSSADHTQLSSRVAGGVEAMAFVYNWGTYDITATSYGVWQAAPDVNHPTLFEPYFRGERNNGWVWVVGPNRFNRGVTFSERPGDQAVRLPIYGITDVYINLDATSLTGEFPPGAYTTYVVLRCE